MEHPIGSLMDTTMEKIKETLRLGLGIPKR